MEHHDDELVELLATLPSDESIDFQLGITRLIEAGGISEDSLQRLLDKYLDRDKQIAYAAFCALSIYYRRHRKIVELGLLISTLI